MWHLFPLVVDDRNRLAARLREEGIPAGVFYPAPVYRMGRHLRQASCPVAEALCKRLLCLRLAPYDEATRQRYAEAVARAFAP